MISFGRQKLKPSRKKISQQEREDPSDKVDYHVPRPKGSSAYLNSIFHWGYQRFPYLLKFYKV